jgi:uncharacterized protein involved in exopolysaccharide biosynthesis
MQLFRYPEFYRNRILFGLIESDPDKIPSSADPRPPEPSTEAYRNSVRHFVGSVDVDPVRRSNLVEVSFYAENAQLAERIANKLADDYIYQNLQVKWDETVKASEWLQGRLEELRGKLEKADDALQAYAQANSIIFLDENKKAVNVRMEQLQGEYTKAQAERFQKESLYSQVEAGKVQDLPAVLSNRLIQDLEERLADLQKDYAQVTTWVKPDYPKALQVKKQMDVLQAELDKQKQAVAQNIVDDYRSAVAKEKYLA